MPRPLERILPALQLSRIGLVFTAVSNIWLVVLLSHAFRDTVAVPAAIRDLPLWALLLCTAAVAVGMYVFGMALNDVMDVRRDRTFAPHRPIPSGRIGLTGATAVTVAALLVAVAASVPLGAISTLLALGCAALILFYNTIGKNLPGTGVVTLGVIRAVHMLIANPALVYLWPVWLTMSHVIGLSAACHKLEGKRPRLAGRSIWMVVGGWAFLSLVLFAWMDHQGVASPPAGGWLWIGPAVAAAVFLAIALRTARRSRNLRAAGGTIMKRGLLWLIVYDAAWLASGGLWGPAALLAALALAALFLMALLRQLHTALGASPAFRRDPDREVPPPG